MPSGDTVIDGRYESRQIAADAETDFRTDWHRHLLDAICTTPLNKRVLSLISPSFRPFNSLMTSSASVYIGLVHLAQLSILSKQRDQIDKAEQPISDQALERPP